jgi:hypothetical protein
MLLCYKETSYPLPSTDAFCSKSNKLVIQKKYRRKPESYANVATELSKGWCLPARAPAEAPEEPPQADCPANEFEKLKNGLHQSRR